MERVITDDLEGMLSALPPKIVEGIRHHQQERELLEVILDLGRLPEARFPGGDAPLNSSEVTGEDIDFVVSRVSEFGEDNRAGIERTLHRISALRNRHGRVVGLTCRVGRAVFGTITIIQDLIESGKSILLLGRPGVGKTTMLREVARVLADDFKKRVVIVDTSNEIAGDGDIPHPAIGHARRMQVRTPAMQHAVMIEAVENHMPQVIVIDEIGTELEAMAARTIAERGVQLVATAHGNILNNLILNPTLSDLIGGIQTVTLGDEEAKRRGTQKSILERKAPPTFEVLVEILDWERVTVHHDVGDAVDAILRNKTPDAEVRSLDEAGKVVIEKTPAAQPDDRQLRRPSLKEGKVMRIYPFGVNRERLEDEAREMNLPLEVVTNISDATVVITSKSYFRAKPKKVRDAEAAGTPIYVLRSNSPPQIRQFLKSIFPREKTDLVTAALEEVEDAVQQVASGENAVDLSPQSSYVRRLQHLLAEKHSLTSRSEGKEPVRHVRILKDDQRA
ncbi:MAG: R3H domain-containing nucleic acid-binding protein [Dehalococcoidia bacterium]|nr:R3H domain-containing nucleic acid-binding protein [Dehalococcoidia bacterium]